MTIANLESKNKELLKESQEKARLTQDKNDLTSQLTQAKAKQQDLTSKLDKSDKEISSLSEVISSLKKKTVRQILYHSQLSYLKRLCGIASIRAKRFAYMLFFFYIITAANA